MYAADAPFKDLHTAKWAEEAIEALASRGAINDVASERFAPSGVVTRAAFITMLMNALELSDNDAVSQLHDVKQGTWHYGAIAAAEQLGIVTGRSNGTFGVNEGITRQEMAVLIARAADIFGIVPGGGFAEAGVFTDESSIAAYAVNAVLDIQKAGLINGLGDGRFAPMDTASRAQAAVIIYRLYRIGR
ncbi:hypothetical protein FHS16_002791 [Paenibacillus endophyticus]|uniref:SLH domain-containing protein n=1 Tax=Paenibacillus endophyticus TaxID=1294268 RepID=A0A7W5C9P6_9BACL|nr:S-layer homology domain-containing protein [Paenibacillus endophyticus]MBB3152734.1 hypothetical protein [Paenibacillus endophyticus]